MSDIEMRPDLSTARTQGMNNYYLQNNFDPGAFREPKRFIYIYSVSAKEFEVPRPPMIPKLIVKACPEGEEYVLAAKLADPYEQGDRDVDTGEPRMRYHDGLKVALDIVCPFAASMDSALPPNSYVIDLRQQGVFISLHNPPLPEEPIRARKRLEVYYRDRLQRAQTLEYTNPKELHENLREDDHLAADYFGEDYSWHKTRTKRAAPVAKTPCPTCGEDIKPGVALHKTEDGEYCILDWKRAYEAGRVTKKQVPAAHHWQGFESA